ncbi:MAG TPA: hypothetical protein VFE27_06435 [Acidobacteriaceae bacterium]|nr:hypothetical protein [Acidobacteriaceae bacterium]
MMYLWFAAVTAALVSAAGAQQVSPPAEVPAEHPGTVIFSRSVEDTATPAKPAAGPAVTPPSDVERQAITFLSYDLDVHLHAREHAMAVRARILVRNDSGSPLDRLVLQVSSSLRWTGVRVADAPATFQQQLVNSDIDHTGALREAIIPLAHPLAPRQNVAVDLTYEGTAALSATRLEQIGTPAEVAEASDWDRISDEFIGLRGFGNVAWYPIASVPVALGDGAKFFTEAAAERQRQSQATVTMRVTEEFFGEAPNLAVLDGEPVTVTPTSLPTAASVPGIVTCTLPPTRLGFASPSLFLVTRTPQEGNGVKVFARTDDVTNAQAYMFAATIVAPLINRWLGTEPRGVLNIVDLPERGDSPFEDGNVLFTDVRDTEPDKLAAVLIHSLTHLYFRSPYAWLQEGVPSFMGSLWLEQSRGRDIAIQQLDNSRGALSLAEPGDTASATTASATIDRQALLVARDPVYYRTKATYVLWMLRDLAGSEALARALRSYQPGSDTAGNGFEQVLERASGKDLKWFFEDWVYHDRGLPDLSIAGVYPNKASVPGSYIVAVDVSNSGTAEAQVPVSVSSGTTTVTEMLRIPAKSRISHRFVLQGKPAEVAVNDGTVPEVEASVHRQTLSMPAAPE